MSAPRSRWITEGREWVLVVPVRAGATGKTRLRAVLGPHTESVATAMALDTVTAGRDVVGADRVLVATPDTSWLTCLAWRPYVVVDQGSGLDEAVASGCRVASSRWPGAFVAVLLGDHPALRPGELRIALQAAEAHELAVLRDAAGDGTALLTAAPGQRLRPAFGPGSADRHVALGHAELALDLPGLRLDVDDESSLHAASEMGLRRHTRRALRSLALSGMQASVHTFGDGRGSVLLDDGREVPFEADAWAASGLRHLRMGQRVSVTLAPDERTVTRLWIVGIGPGEAIR